MARVTCMRIFCAALFAVAGADGAAQSGPSTGSGQAYPAKAVRIIVPSSPGGGTDIVTRLLAPKLTERLGQPVVVENRPGAGTMIGIEAAAKAPADGYTLLMGLSTLAINPTVYKKVPYDAQRDFAPVTQVISAPNILVVHPSVPAHSVKALIALARARPGQLNFASAGLGTNPHFSMELFLSMANVRMTHIPYKGSGPAMIDLIAGQVVVMTATMLTGLPHTRSGRLRGLGTTGEKRSVAAPDLPTVAESGLPGYEATQWYGMLAPANTPREVVNRLHLEVTRLLQLPEIRDKLVNDGTDPVGNTPEEFARYIRSEIDKWAKVARAAGIKPE